MFVFVVLFIISVVYYLPWTEEECCGERKCYFLQKNNTTTVSIMSTDTQTNTQTLLVEVMGDPGNPPPGLANSYEKKNK
jgi:hypothetical protein